MNYYPCGTCENCKKLKNGFQSIEADENTICLNYYDLKKKCTGGQNVNLSRRLKHLMAIMVGLEPRLSNNNATIQEFIKSYAPPNK